MADVRIAIFDHMEHADLLANTPIAVQLKAQHLHEKLNNVTIAKTIGDDCDPDIALMLFTSGTTGRSKAVMLHHSNFIYSINAFIQHLGVSEQDRCLTVLPIFHVASLVTSIFVPLCSGMTIIFLLELNAENLAKAFKELSPSYLAGVPRLYQMFDDKITQEIHNMPQLKRAIVKRLISISTFFRRVCGWRAGRVLLTPIHKQFGERDITMMSGGAPLAEALRQRFIGYGFDLRCAYGLTETTGPVSISNGTAAWPVRGVGQVLAGSAYHIEHPDNDSIGDVVYQGPACMQGYFRNQQATDKVLSERGFNTGDLGSLNSDQALVVSGRKKSLIVFADGKKAMPEQIESMYQGIAGVKDMAVFSQTLDNDSLIAAIAYVAEDDVETAAIAAAFYAKASQLKSPYRIARVYGIDDIPKNNTFKVLHQKLAEKVAQVTFAQASACARKNTDTIIELFSSQKITATPAMTFAELGIDSLKATALCDKLNTQYDLALKPTIFWQLQTLGDLILYIKGKPASAPTIKVEKTMKQTDDIAIIAMNCRFPGGANSPELFWKNLSEGRDVIAEITDDRWVIDDYYDEDILSPGKMNSRYAGLIDNYNDFDAKRFAMKPRVASTIDPQQKLALTQVADMLEQTAQGLAGWKNTNTAVFIGSCSVDYLIRLAKVLPETKVNAFMGTGLANCAIAGRIAYHFGLQGPAMVLDTACSSSLVAVHQASRALQAHDCDAAIAGGVELLLDPFKSIAFAKAGMLSPRGRCYTFDKSADGYVRAEGCGVVLLKRLADVQDNEDVIAVIKGSSMNQDGISNGFTAPNMQAQINCSKAALAESGIDPSALNYIEAHGTGTPLGDPIEMESIGAVYAATRTPDTPLYVGAVKTQMGHAESAAGMAGLIKTLLIMQHQAVPANLHFSDLNPAIDLLGGALVLPDQLIHTSIKAAALNSFGFTGTNAHLILSC